MDIKVDFEPEHVAEALKKAIITSSFAEMFTKAANEQIDEIKKQDSNWSGTRSWVTSFVRAFIEKEIRDVMETEYRDQIRNAIKEKLTTEKLDEFVDELTSSIRFKSY